jgi:ABC-type branched-subunit amino acid transport system substrate-binding protein
MGSVFLAHDTHVNNKPVVIKEMANVYATEAERREAEAEFQAEMATLAALSHPNIPQISDFFTESNRHFAVQEYVSGQDLQKATEAAQVPGEPPHGLPEKQVLAWISQVLSVLDYLEAQNPQVIHRDIKPGNIIVDANNRVRVVDFGIASHKFKPGSTRAVGQQISTALGTPGYAPKEQFVGQETPLSDLYALGATMHHLLTGRDPTKIQPLWQYPPVRVLNPKISEATERIVARALQNDPKKRYQSAAEMKRDVDRVLNPPGALNTVRGRAIAVLVVLLLLVGVGGGAYEYVRLQTLQRPVGALSYGGNVAFDTDQAGLAALGISSADGKQWAADKIQASKDMANGNAQKAISEYQAAATINPADAESAIYIEDNSVLALDPHPYRIAIGGSFSPSADNTSDNVSVGRQNLQGAYTAQKLINDAGGIHGHLVYLVLASDSSSASGAQGAAQKLAGRKDILGLVGFAFSARTKAALPYVAAHGIPQISPTASNPNLTGSPYFFRTCPSDLQQGQAGLGYLLGTLLKGKPHPTIAVFGDPSDAYAGGLQTVIQNAATRRGANVVREDYAIGQSDFSALAQDVKAHHVDAVYFAGYAREALLLSQAMDAAGIPRSVPIMTDDGFYDPQSFIANRTQKGRFHFTSFFFPDEYSLLSGADRQRILAMEQAYTQNFLKAGVAAGGYGTSRVSADTALTYDAVRTLAYAIGRLPPNGVTRQGLQGVLSGIGLNTPAFPGVTGHIRYATSTQAATGDPIDKAIVVMHLDTHGFSHMDRIVGRY